MERRSAGLFCLPFSLFLSFPMAILSPSSEVDDIGLLVVLFILVNSRDDRPTLSERGKTDRWIKE